jgi:HYR domain
MRTARATGLIIPCVLVLLTGLAQAADMTWRIQNAGFDDPVAMAGWPLAQDGPSIDSYANAWPVGGFPTNQPRFATFATKAGTALAMGDTESRSQVIDLSDVDTILFDAKLYSTSWQSAVAGEVRLDGTVVWSRTAQGEYYSQRINVLGMTGTHTLEIRETVTKAGTFAASQWACWDRFRATGSIAIPPDAVPIALSGNPPRGQASGSLGSADEEDWYYVDVPVDAGGDWHLWTQIGPDTVLSVHVPPQGAEVASDDDCPLSASECTLDHDADGLHSRIDMALTAGARYYLKVRAYTAGTYTVKVMGPEVGVQPPDADAGPDQTVEQATAAGTEVTLDGSGSANAQSFEWREGATVLGTAAVVKVVLPLGVHTITLTVTAGGATDTDEVVVTVADTTAPKVTPPDDVSAEQTSGDGTPVALGTATATDVCDASPAITNDAPAVFPLGVTDVTWTATDISGNKGTAVQKVTIVDTGLPTITAPPDLTAEQADPDGSGLNLGAPIVSDLCDAQPKVTNDAPAIFPLGDTVVTWTVTDSSGNQASATQKVTVVDTTPPSLVVEATVKAEQTSPNGTPVDLGTPEVRDFCDATPVVTNDAPAVFPLGRTTVTWTATDASGNQATATQRVVVADTTAPALVPPPDIRVEQGTRDGTVIPLGIPQVTDICDAAPVVTNNAPAVFSLGTTMVTWTATDASGNVAKARQKVVVADTIPPHMNFTVVQRSFSPADRKMKLAAIVHGVRDKCDASPHVCIDVTANEPVEGPADVRPDWRVVKLGQTWFVFLRAERANPSGTREYYVKATATDDSGNVTSVTETFRVPRDRR